MTGCVLIPCADGSAADCYGLTPAIEVTETFEDMTEEQQEEIAGLASVHSPTEGDFEEEIEGVFVQFEPAVCAACGSDYDRDEEGNIID
jgi:hypothetical protein